MYSVDIYSTLQLGIITIFGIRDSILDMVVEMTWDLSCGGTDNKQVNI